MDAGKTVFVWTDQELWLRPRVGQVLRSGGKEHATDGPFSVTTNRLVATPRWRAKKSETPRRKINGKTRFRDAWFSKDHSPPLLFEGCVLQWGQKYHNNDPGSGREFCQLFKSPNQILQYHCVDKSNCFSVFLSLVFNSCHYTFERRRYFPVGGWRQENDWRFNVSSDSTMSVALSNVQIAVDYSVRVHGRYKPRPRTIIQVDRCSLL